MHTAAFNWIGVGTLYRKEVMRFVKVAMQTVAAPVMTTLLFMAVFILAMPEGRSVAGMPFFVYLAPGLVMMAITQNAFANASSSLIIGKVNGNIVDVLLPPLSPFELTLGYGLGAATRGLVVGIVVALAMRLFVPVAISHPLALCYYAVSGALMLGLTGILAGIWANKFDHMATITNFIITPLAFLSGTFYSIDRLPGIWHTLASNNPFFFLIDGMRWAMTGHSDGEPLTGGLVLLVLNALLWAACQTLFASGYKLRA